MSCEWVVFHSEFASTLDEADDAFNLSTYYETSHPPADESARKWKLRDALVAANPELQHDDKFVVCDAETGVEETRPCLRVIDWEADDCIEFHVYDDAVEIRLPQALHEATPESVVREALSYVNLLAREGFSVALDAQEAVLIDPAKDLNALVARYTDTLKYFAEEDAKASIPTSTSAAAQTSSGLVDEAREHKPWWKIW